MVVKIIIRKKANILDIFRIVSHYHDNDFQTTASLGHTLQCCTGLLTLFTLFLNGQSVVLKQVQHGDSQPSALN